MRRDSSALKLGNSVMGFKSPSWRIMGGWPMTKCRSEAPFCTAAFKISIISIAALLRFTNLSRRRFLARLEILRRDQTLLSQLGGGAGQTHHAFASAHFD